MNKNIFLIISSIFFSANAIADEQAELAKKLNNPVASLISVPVQYIVDEDIGAAKTGKVTQYKISPVLPFSFNENWNVISRTIFSLVDQENIPTQGVGESGISDIAESIFFSPKAPTESGWIWGVGGIFLLDTASEDQLGAGKWGMGPTGVALRSSGALDLWWFNALPGGCSR